METNQDFFAANDRPSGTRTEQQKNKNNNKVKYIL